MQALSAQEKLRRYAVPCQKSTASRDCSTSWRRPSENSRIMRHAEEAIVSSAAIEDFTHPASLRRCSLPRCFQRRSTSIYYLNLQRVVSRACTVQGVSIVTIAAPVFGTL